MSSSFKADENKINNIINHYLDYKVENDNENIIFAAKNSDFSLLIYKTGTVLFQGINKDIELSKWIDNTSQYENIINMGSDEVGCGDYFGPVVVCAALVDKNDYDFLVNLGVTDSKKLSDTQINNIAPKLIRKIKYAKFVLSNKKYNEMVENGCNLNKIKAYLHNFVLTKLIDKTKYEGLVVIDDFCGENLYYRYLNDFKDKITYGITFKTKAESIYLSVAVASIIARYNFLKEIKKIEDVLGVNIPLGGGIKATEIAKKIKDDKGIDYLKNYIKYHFKNTKEL